jgi:hypothetical protein
MYGEVAPPVQRYESAVLDTNIACLGLDVVQSVLETMVMVGGGGEVTDVITLLAEEGIMQ